MSPMRVLVADDEALARRRLVRLLSALPDVEVVGTCADGAEVVARVRVGDVDVVLLDVRMPRLSGTEALALLGPTAPVVVFTTAHADHAVQAFDLEAADYVLKPVEAERLARALERARARLAARVPVAAGPPPSGPPARLAIPTRHGVVLVDPGDVTHAQLDGVTCTVHADGGRYVTDFRLADLEQRLPADRFVRVHRRALVNLDAVVRLEPVATGGYRAHLTDGAVVAVSRQAARLLRRHFGLRRPPPGTDGAP